MYEGKTKKNAWARLGIIAAAMVALLIFSFVGGLWTGRGKEFVRRETVGYL